jgi:hypothetical protein
MAAPNLIGATTINGKTTAANLTTTSETVVLNNAASSGKALKVNTVIISNSSSSAITANVYYHDAASLGGTAYAIIGGASIPGNTSLTVTDKTIQIYLEENTSLGASAGVANYLNVIVSYEDIS